MLAEYVPTAEQRALVENAAAFGIHIKRMVPECQASRQLAGWRLHAVPVPARRS
jgi:hypothetical protein